jgi:hypothetical protein
VNGPVRMQSMSTDLKAVITITGRSGRAPRAASTRSIPLMPGIRMSATNRSVRAAETKLSAEAPSFAVSTTSRGSAFASRLVSDHARASSSSTRTILRASLVPSTIDHEELQSTCQSARRAIGSSG